MLGSFGGTNSIPFGINAAGTVVGDAVDVAGQNQAFVYDGTLRAIGSLPPCAANGDPTSVARGINDLGDVVGGSCGQAFLYSGGRLTSVGVMPGFIGGLASAINNKGQMVGVAGNHIQGSGRATVYDWTSGAWIDLNMVSSPLPGGGLVLGEAMAINDNGQILARGYNADGSIHRSYLLTPIVSPATAAPSSTGKPSISGLPVSGDLLTATAGSWAGAPPSYAYQWMRCASDGGSCVDVFGSNASTYRLTGVDLGGFTIRVRVTATNQYGTASAQSDPTAVIETPLNAFAPQLWYDHRDSYRADLASEITDNCWQENSFTTHNNYLYDGLENQLASVCPANGPSGPLDHLSLDYLGPRYPGGRQSTSDDHIDERNFDYVQDFQRLHDLPGYADQIYGRIVAGPGGATILQYWFFYYYNGGWFIDGLGGLGGEHEGDWEGLQLYLDPNGNPVDATYYQHTIGERCGWNSFAHSALHPVVLVANGSHASYFTSGPHSTEPVGTDHAEAGVLPVSPTVVDVSNSPADSWLYWKGRWGGTPPGTPVTPSSPNGPSQGAKWDAFGYLSGPDTRPCTVPGALRKLKVQRTTAFTSRHQVASTPTVPVPKVSARRVGGRAVLNYCFADVPKSLARRPWWLEITLQSADRRIPPYSKWWRAQLPCGRLTQPTGRGPGPFHVLVTAASKHGVESRILRVRVR
jgi:probable HAF family extracellular repeat protein